MTKSEAIDIVNNHLGKLELNNSNTNFSKINENKEVWWLNIPLDRFSFDLHLILLNQKGFNWIKIPANKIQNLDKVFRIRKDKDVVDLEISSAKEYLYLKDVKSGGSNFNFRAYLQHVFE